MRRFRFGVFAAFGLALAAAAWYLRLRAATGGAAARGERVAARMGCFACHGPGGAGGVPNPGAAEPVPAFSPASAQAAIRDEGDLEQWVMDGRPARLREAARTDDPLLTMPAYRGRLSSSQWRELRAWLRAMHGLDAPPPSAPAARAGWEAAREAGCFGCHGPSGRGLRRNPGSFAGAIPGWDSAAFSDLARDEAEIEAWIRTGTSARLEKNPAARHFLRRQQIQMPPYDATLEDEKIAAIVAYIRWLRQRPD